MSKTITTIEKGWGEDSIYYRVGHNKITGIAEDIKAIEFDKDHNACKHILVYHVIKNGEVINEIESNSGIIVSYD